MNQHTGSTITDLQKLVADAEFARLLYDVMPQLRTPPKPRYFAIVVCVPGDQADVKLGGVLRASTVLGNMFREKAPGFMPDGTRITRSIEITEEFAQRTW